MRGTLAVSVRQSLTLALLVGGPGSAENEVMPTPPASHQKRVCKADWAVGRLHSRCVDPGPSGPQIDDAEERDDAADDADAYTTGDALLHWGPTTDDAEEQDDAADYAADGAAADDAEFLDADCCDAERSLHRDSADEADQRDDATDDDAEPQARDGSQDGDDSQATLHLMSPVPTYGAEINGESDDATDR